MVPENHKDDPHEFEGASDPMAYADDLDLDEDLFDFPELDLIEPIAIQPDPVVAQAQQQAPAPMPAPVTTPEPVAQKETVEQPMPEPRSADGNDFTPGDPLEATSYDLDEDLFDFGEVFDSIPAPVATTQPAPATPATPEPNYDDVPAAQASAEPLSSIVENSLETAEDILDLDADPAITPMPSPAATITPVAAAPSASTSLPTSPAQPFRAAEGFDPRMAPAAPTADAPKSRSRIVEVLAICFLVVNVSMVFFAWRAGDEFRQTLAHVSGTVNEALINNNANTTASAPITQEPIVEITPGPFDIEVEGDEVSIPDMSRTALELARRRIENSEFEDARRGLQRLLANQDRAALEPQQVSEAELLIARSYYLEGLEIREDV